MLSAWTSSVLPSVGEGRIKEQEEELMLNTLLSLKPEGSKGTGPWGGVRVCYFHWKREGKYHALPPPFQRKCTLTSSLYSARRM